MTGPTGPLFPKQLATTISPAGVLAGGAAAEVIIDSMRHYLNTQVDKKWHLGSSQGFETSATLAPYGASAHVGGGEGFEWQGKLKYGAWSVGFRFRPNRISANGSDLFKLRFFQLAPPFNADTAQARLRMRPDGRLAIHDVANQEVGHTLGSINNNHWAHIVAQFQLGPVGNFRIFLNSELASEGTANFQFDITQVGANYATLGRNFEDGVGAYIEDPWLVAGSAYIPWGDSRVVLLKPNGEGTHLEWIPSSGGTHYTKVDEVPHDAGDYAYDEAIAGRRDTYNFEDLTIPNITDILDVQGVAWARLSGGNPVRHLLSAGGNDKNGPDIGNSDRYDLASWIADPFNDLAWTESGVNGVEYGVMTHAPE